MVGGFDVTKGNGSANKVEEENRKGKREGKWRRGRGKERGKEKGKWRVKKKLVYAIGDVGEKPSKEVQMELTMAYETPFIECVISPWNKNAI